METAILKRFDVAFAWADGNVPALAEKGEPPARCALCGGELQGPAGAWLGFEANGQYTTGLYCPACLPAVARGEAPCVTTS